MLAGHRVTTNDLRLPLLPRTPIEQPSNRVSPSRTGLFNPTSLASARRVRGSKECQEVAIPVTTHHLLATVYNTSTNFSAGKIANNFTFWTSLTADSHILPMVRGLSIDFDKTPTNQSILPKPLVFSDTKKTAATFETLTLSCHPVCLALLLSVRVQHISETEKRSLTSSYFNLEGTKLKCILCAFQNGHLPQCCGSGN